MELTGELKEDLFSEMAKGNPRPPHGLFKHPSTTLIGGQSGSRKTSTWCRLLNNLKIFDPVQRHKMNRKIVKANLKDFMKSRGIPLGDEDDGNGDGGDDDDNGTLSAAASEKKLTLKDEREKQGINSKGELFKMTKYKSIFIVNSVDDDEYCFDNHTEDVFLYKVGIVSYADQVTAAIKKILKDKWDNVDKDPELYPIALILDDMSGKMGRKGMHEILTTVHQLVHHIGLSLFVIYQDLFDDNADGLISLRASCDYLAMHGANTLTGGRGLKALKIVDALEFDLIARFYSEVDKYLYFIFRMTDAANDAKEIATRDFMSFFPYEEAAAIVLRALVTTDAVIEDDDEKTDIPKKRSRGRPRKIKTDSDVVVASKKRKHTKTLLPSSSSE